MAQYTSRVIQAYRQGRQTRLEKEDRENRDKQQELQQKNLQQRLKEEQARFKERMQMDRENQEHNRKIQEFNVAQAIRKATEEGTYQAPGAEVLPSHTDLNTLVPIQGGRDLQTAPFFHKPGFTDPQTGVEIGENTYRLEGEKSAVEEAILRQRGQLANELAVDRASDIAAATHPYAVDTLTRKENLRAKSEEEKHARSVELQNIKDTAALQRARENNNSREAAARSRMLQAREAIQANTYNPTNFLPDVKAGIITSGDIKGTKESNALLSEARAAGLKLLSPADKDDLSAIRVMNTVISEYERLADVFASNNPARAGEVLAIKESVGQYFAQVSQIIGEQPASRISDKDIDLIKGGQPNLKGHLFGAENTDRINKAKVFVNKKLQEILTGASDEQVTELKNTFSFQDYDVKSETRSEEIEWIFDEQGNPVQVPNA